MQHVLHVRAGAIESHLSLDHWKGPQSLELAEAGSLS